MDATITGKDTNNITISEVLTLSNGGTATSVLYYKSITSTAVDGAVTGNVEAGPLKANGAVSAMIVPDLKRYRPDFALEVRVTGTLTYDVEYSMDDCISGTAASWNTHEVLNSKTATDVSNVMFAIGCIRTKITAYTSGTTATTIIQYAK